MNAIILHFTGALMLLVLILMALSGQELDTFICFLLMIFSTILVIFSERYENIIG